MIEMISPLLRKLAFSNLLSQTKEFILPFTECPCANTYSNEESQETQEQPVTSAVDLFSYFTADIINKQVVFFR